MDANRMLEQLALATFEYAEAETLERRATKKRLSAAKRMAAIHAEFKEAVEAAKKSKAR